MLKKSLIPTPLVVDEARSLIEIAPLRALGRFRTGKFAIRLIGFAFYWLWARKIRRVSDAEFAAAVRSFIEGLGGLWIKAGQIMSLRTDVLSRAMADELASLQGRVVGFPPEIARQMIEKSMGRRIEDVFDVFEPHPFAAASIAQVHRARLRSEDKWVVIKVQRPDIAEIFQRDLRIIGFFVRLAKRVPSISYVAWDGLIREIRRIMEEETDYRYEAENLHRMRKILRKQRVHVPKTFQRYNSQSVLVMEYVEGVLMSDYLRVFRADPARAAAWREENKISAKKVGARLLTSLYRQMFEDNLFHGDLHPGNVILLRNNRFALIDLGTIGSLERRFLTLYQYQTQSFAQGDYSKSFDYYLMMADSIPIFEISEFKADAVAIVRAWEARTHLRSLSYYEKSVTGGVGTDLAQLASKYRINLSWQFLRVSRSLGTMDASLVALLGNTNPNKIMKRYFAQLRRRRLQTLLGGELLRMAADMLSEFRQNSTFTADTLRLQAIKFEGVRSTASFIAGAALRLIRVALFGGGLILVYTFLHRHFAAAVEPVRDNIGAFSAVETVVPGNFPVEFYGAALIAILIGYWGSGRMKHRLETKTIRLPDGRLDR